MPKQSPKKRTAKKARVVKLPLKEDHSKETILQQAEAAKKEDDLDAAEDLYKKQIDEKHFNAAAYSKLMIVYRKQKKYKEELALINKGLQHFKDYESEKVNAKNNNAAIKKLSKSLSKSLGLTDKKGNSIYEPAPIVQWKKRKLTVEKKIKST